MRRTTLLLVIALALGRSAVYGQITLREKNAPLEKVLTDIEKQTKYVFLYDPDALKAPPVTISIKNANLEKTLGQLFDNLPIEFTVVDNNVLLKAKLTTTTLPINNIIVRGKVVDSAGQPLPGVTVVAKREQKATQTDTSGAYTLKAAKGDILRFSFVGYNDHEITIGDQPLINAKLEVNPSGADQVVVIGYGGSKRKDLTGAVSIVDIQDFGTTAFNTFDNALAGKATGVDVTKTDGTPGGMIRIRIRGSSSLLAGNDPLYVIDGVPVQVRSNYIPPGFGVASPNANLTGVYGVVGNEVALSTSFVNGLNSLGGLNPEDIESMTILKDASSAAIYGSKAANGVVIIATKTGKTNMLPRLEVSYSSTLSSPYRTPKLLNASQYKTLITEAAHNAAADDTIPGYFIFPLAITSAVLDSPTYFGTANTNWVRQVTRTTLSNNVGLSISGGGQASKYFSSIAYSSTPGVVDGTDYQRISGKLNLESQIGSKGQIAVNLLPGFTSQDIGNGAYAQALLARPDLAPRDASGGFTNFDLLAGSDPTSGLINPAALATATNNAKTFSLLGTVSLSYAIFNNLKFRSAVSLNMENYNQRNYVPGNVDVSVSNIGYPYTGGVSSDGNSRFADWFLENTLSYNKQFHTNHALNIVIGQSYESTKYSYFTATAAGYPNGSTPGLSSGDTVLSVSGDEPGSPQSYLLSFYARTNYSYRDKYLLTFTGRADGSSRFGPDNKFGYFPSGAIAWRISRENFLKKAGWINDLKLRGSYGLTGNQNIGDQTAYTLYSPITYAGSGGLIPTQLGNEKVKWESTREADVGIDLSLLGDRLYSTVDYYNRQTGDAILSLPAPQSSSYPTLTQNAVGLRNRGFEASVGGDIIRTRSFKWAASVNATWNRSLVTKINANANVAQIVSLSGLENVGGTLVNNAIYPFGNTALLKGKPLGLITGYYITGIIKTQAQLNAYSQQLGSAQLTPLQLGDPMYRLDSSTASQGYENPAYNAILGHGAPNYFGGVTQEFSYKNVTLHFLFTFSEGGHLLWVQHGASNEFYNAANAGVAMLNRYTPSNTNTNAPGLDLYDQIQHPTNLDVFGSSYFKLRSVVLGYTIDRTKWIKRSGIQRVQLFVSATNVFTITKYPGSDPETSDDAYSVTGGYFDAGNYPATRAFSVGLKAGF